MNSKDYWAKRSALDMVEYMRTADETATLIKETAEQALEVIRNEIKGIFSAFTSFGISEADAKRILSGGGTVLQQIRRAAEKLEDPKQKQALLSAINSAGAYRFRIQRLEEVSKQITEQCKELYKAQLEATETTLRSVAEDAYYHTMFNLQKETGLAFSFAQFPKKQIDKILAFNWSGAHFSQRIWRNTDILAQAIKDEMLVSLLSGRSNAKTMQVIREQFNVNSFCAWRLVRTESSYVSNAAVSEGYKEADIEKYRFIATLDNRTSEECSALDGKVFKLADKKVGTNFPPMHPFCRSTTIADFGEETLKSLQRRAKDKDGKTMKVPADMTYQVWAEQNGISIATSKQESSDLQSRIRSRRQNFRNRNTDTQKPVIADLTGMNNQQLAEWSKSNLKTQIGDLTGVNNEFAKEAIEAVRDFENKMGGTIDGLSIKFGGVKSGAYAQYDSNTNTIFLKKTGALAKVNEQMQKTNEKAIRKTGKVWDAVPTYKGSIFHELGHAVDHSTGQSLSASLMKTKDLETKAKRISIYAGNSGAIGAPRTSEAWAENFSAYMSGGSYAKNVSIEITSMIDGYFKRISLDKSAKNGIIKSLDIDDFELMAGANKVNKDIVDTITSVVKKYESSKEIYISDFYFGSLPPDKHGIPLLQIDPIADKTLRLNVNTDIFTGRTVKEINDMIKATTSTVANNLEEAVIHECGHAKSIKGKTINEIKEFYAKILKAEIKGISKIAYADGAEALAEIEILLSRGDNIPAHAMKFYNDNMGRK